jgi:hypothetical protein
MAALVSATVVAAGGNYCCGDFAVFRRAEDVQRKLYGSKHWDLDDRLQSCLQVPVFGDESF